MNIKSREMTVDFHAHILPGADHGSSSLEMSLFQLCLAKASGINKIIATPHFYPSMHTVDRFIEKRQKAYELLLPHLQELPRIKLGAEVLICNGIENLPDLDKLFIKGTNVMLLELPYSDFQKEYLYSVENLVASDVEVVLAHAERYRADTVRQMIECGARIQMNASSLRTALKRRSVQYNWFREGYVVALGSDIHGKDRHAYRAFNRAGRRLCEYADLINSFSDRVWNSAEY